jgi:hypothetical protein
MFEPATFSTLRLSPSCPMGAAKGTPLSRLLRRLHVCLAVIVVIALQTHGAMVSQHRVEHSLDFPGAAYAHTAAADHVHDDDHGASEQASSGDAISGDTVEADGNEAPVRHHHHGGGDIQLALVGSAGTLPPGPASSANKGPLREALPPGVSDDGPSHPPKQHSLIA